MPSSDLPGDDIRKPRPPLPSGSSYDFNDTAATLKDLLDRIEALEEKLNKNAD